MTKKAALTGTQLNVRFERDGEVLQQVNADVSALGTAAAVSCVSALEDIPVRQDTVVIGSLAVSGRLRAIEGVTQMIEGAADLGYTRAVVPEANRNDILLEHTYRNQIEVHLARDLTEVLAHCLVGNPTRITAIQNELRRKPSKRAK